MEIRSVAFVVAVLLVKNCSPKVTLEIHLHSYSNPEHRVDGGHCCEQKYTEQANGITDERCELFEAGKPPPLCKACGESCDNKFKVHVCTLDGGAELKALKEYETAVVGNGDSDSFTFPDKMSFSKDTSQGENFNRFIENPIKFKRDEIGEYKGSFRVNITVNDDDGYEKLGKAANVGTEMVATLEEDITAEASASESAATEENVTMSQVFSYGKPGELKTYAVNLTFSYKIWCQDNFYPPNCAIECKATDTDQGGHYTCDQKGTKVCNKCWKGVQCTEKDTLDTECVKTPTTTKAATTQANTTQPATTIAPTTTPADGNGNSGAQKNNDSSDTVAAVVTPLVILAALAGIAGAAYYFVIRKKMRKNKIEDSTTEMQSAAADVPTHQAIDTPDA